MGQWDGNEGTYGVPRTVCAMWDSGMGMKGHTDSLSHVGLRNGNEAVIYLSMVDMVCPIEDRGL